MVKWNSAYRRLNLDPDFRLLFGKHYRQDEFTHLVYSAQFPQLPPALLADPAGLEPNTGDLAETKVAIGIPTSNIVPGQQQVKLVEFPAGAIILGVLGACNKLQRNPDPGTPVVFQYGPSIRTGNLDLASIRLTYADNLGITARPPIPELSVNPNYIANSTPPFMLEAVLGTGMQNELFPEREIYVTPGQGLFVTIESLVLPDVIPATGDRIPSNMTVHIAFHAMVPTESVRRRSAA